MRRVDDHQAGARRQRGGEPLPIHGKRGRLQGEAFEYAAGQRHRRRIAIVAGIEADHLIAGAHQRADGGEQRFGGAGGDGHFSSGVRQPAIQLGGFVGDGFAQRRHPGHRRILVGALGDVPGQAFFQVVRPVEIREALRQVDRLMLLR